MEEIKIIIPPIRLLDVPNISNSFDYIPRVQFIRVPVTVHIGKPIVDIPGCVKAHPQDKGKSSSLVDDDPDGTVIYCDAEYPSYDAMDYVPEEIVITYEEQPPVVEPPPDAPSPEVKPPEIPPNKTECPAPNQPRVGDLTQNGEEKVIGHELQGTTCVVLYEPTTPVEKFLPSTNQVSVTAAIAVVATASAAATPLLLRAIKPIIKKLTTTVQKKLGKHRELSRSEIRANAYRAKKGLPPLKLK